MIEVRPKVDAAVDLLAKLLEFRHVTAALLFVAIVIAFPFGWSHQQCGDAWKIVVFAAIGSSTLWLFAALISVYNKSAAYLSGLVNGFAAISALVAAATSIGYPGTKAWAGCGGPIGHVSTQLLQHLIEP